MRLIQSFLRFNEAEKLMSGGESPLHLVFRAQMCAQKAGLTFERDEIMVNSLMGITRKMIMKVVKVFKCNLIPGCS